LSIESQRLEGGESPIDILETLGIVAFLQAASGSRVKGERVISPAIALKP
jgi:hypothetical protein